MKYVKSTPLMTNNQSWKPVNPVAYKDAGTIFPPSYQLFEDMKLTFSDQQKYFISEKLGYGKYSDVFKGFVKDDENNPTDEVVVIKVLKPVRYAKVYREIKILSNLINGPFTLKLLDVVSVARSDYPAFINEFGGECLESVASSLSLKEIKLFIGELLIALHYCHIHSIIHRDVKGGNICVNTRTNRLVLLDFGLAEFYEYGKSLHHRVATRHYKSPELLCNYQLYDYSLDVWSTGAMLAGFLFERQPFFRGSSNNNQLDKIIEVTGSYDFIEMLKKYNITLENSRIQELSGYKKVPLKEFMNPDNTHLVDSNAIELLEEMLCIDPEERPTCEKLLEHSWFDDVRELLAESYIDEFKQVEAHLNTQCRSIPQPCLPSYEYIDNIQYPVPVSPNTIAKQQIFDENRWLEGWVEFERQCNKLGWDHEEKQEK